MENPSGDLSRLVAGLQWMVGQFQGDSGTGESYWEQFPEYREIRALLTELEGGTVK